MAPDAQQTWSLVALSPLPRAALWLLVGGVLAAGVAVAAALLRPPRRPGVAALRLAGAVALAALLLEPALERRAVRHVPGRLAVVIDRSASMALPAAGDARRIDRARALWEADRPARARLAAEAHLDLFDLDGRLAEAGLALPPQGTGSDLVAALERARDAGGAPLAGILLISDGADTAALAPADLPAAPLSAAARARLVALGVPVNVVDAAAGATACDLRVLPPTADDFAFVRTTLPVELAVAARGCGTVEVPVTLRRGGAVVGTQTVRVPDGDQARATFRLRPERVGDLVLSAAVPVLPGEAQVANNEQSWAVQVIRDKIRVLQVAGRPSWDERFLRQHLKENPNADLISFFILRTPADDMTIPEAELSLIPFPVQRLFTTELASFDVIVLQDFDFRPYQMAPFLPNIRDAVQRGLGLIMVGGQDSFGGGGYAGTAVAEVLPVRPGTEGMRRGPFHPRLTPAGHHHPLTALGHAGEAESRWQALPPLDAVNQVGEAAPGATVLAEVDGMPLIAAREVGRGRAASLATDSLWRWRFAGGPAAERAYQQLWGATLRWLSGDPEHARVRIAAPRRSEAGSAAALTVTVVGADYQPLAGAEVTLALAPAGGEAPAATGQAPVRLTTDALGLARHPLAALPAGAYVAEARARAGREDLGEASAAFVIRTESAELADPAPRPATLAAIAEATGGAVLAPDGMRWDRVARRSLDVVEVSRRERTTLWDRGAVLALLAGLWLAEWAWRRRHGEA